ncbi:type III pantothenate kinase [Marinomonas sp. 2405UD68-3]|uniref:type III pantothenate kinase n=1 Tax=Marinomonas sp. 2405UD68-3 TaxID=3391835 RepID=UPI0039C974BF
MSVSKSTNSKPYILVVDAGNTSIKWSVFLGDDIVWRGRDKDIDTQCFDIKSVYFASVRGREANQILLDSIQDRYKKAVCTLLDVRSHACNVINAYDEPYRLGIDRWLGVLYAYHRYQSNVVIIDAGTAVKIDVIDKNGKHLGGYIAPGGRLMEQALTSNTGRIRFSEDDMEDIDGLPKNTGQAVRLGCREMMFGFVERVLRDYPNSVFLFTGGDGEYLMKQLDVDGFFDPDIVLKGAKLLGDERVIM